MNPEQTNNSASNTSEKTTTPHANINQDLGIIPPKVPKKKWKKRFIIAAITMILLIGYMLLFSLFFGGETSEPKLAPNPQSPSLISKRDAAKDSISNSFAAVDSKLGFTNYATSSHDRCFEGQNNWKVKDGYAHRCTHRVTKFYGFSGDLDQQLNNIEQHITVLGWKHRYGYGPNGIGYLKGKGELETVYTEGPTEDFFSIEYTQKVSGDTLFDTYDKEDFQDIPSLYQKITQECSFVLAISIQEDYFQN